LKSQIISQDELSHHKFLLFVDLISQIKETHILKEKNPFQEIQNLLKFKRFNK